MTRFDDYCSRQRALYGDKFKEPEGAHLIDAYNQAPRLRVKVRTTYSGGETFERWGFLGITTGWEPAFLLMRQIGQHGSSDVLTADDVIVERRTK